jgi:putative transposase
VNVPYHITQRGNGRRSILDRDNDRAVYLKLLQEYTELHGVSVLGYCIMSNHVHLIAIPAAVDSLALALRSAHGRYAAYWNASHGWSGHAWQGRFYSCPLDETHLWEALRYTELNPLRARLVSEAESWPWSSAAVHCGTNRPHPLLSDALWGSRWTVASWRGYLGAQDAGVGLDAIRKFTHTGRPLGDSEFNKRLEEAVGRRLVAKKKTGRARFVASDQGELPLNA